MDERRIYRSLRQTALSLRPPASDRSISLIRIANDHAIDVHLVLGRNFDRTRHLARCELGSKPIISLYRRGQAEAVAPLSPNDEAALTTRERFSVAHELGHCLAYLVYEFRPLTRRDDPQRYWEQERAMDEFAGTLLVPPWLTEQWLHETSQMDATCVFRLRSWAGDSSVSSEVVTRALCRSAPELGFLKVAEAKRLKDGAPLFVVLHSAAGRNIQLPNQHSHVESEVLLTTVVGKTGVDRIQAEEISSRRTGQVQIAWIASRTSINSRRREFRSTIHLSGISYWICVMDLPEPHGVKQPELLS